MTLEPIGGVEETGPSPELIDMTRRFWTGAVLAVPTVILEMGGHFAGPNLHHYISPQLSVWLQFALGTPVVLWAGWPFFVRGAAPVRNRSLNMFSLIALGVGAAYLYSLAATFAPSLFPTGLRQRRGHHPGLLRGCGRHHGARPARPGPGASGAGTDGQRHPRALRSCAQGGSPHPRRRCRRRNPLEQVHIGDRLRVRPGDSVPVDGAVLEGAQRGR